MTITYLACGACVAFALAFLFAVMTWRRTLARQLLILTLSSLAIFLMLPGMGHSWLAVFSASVCIAAITLLLLEEIQRTKQKHRHRPVVAA
jgi:hypothetical protein